MHADSYIVIREGVVTFPLSCFIAIFNVVILVVATMY